MMPMWLIVTGTIVGFALLVTAMVVAHYEGRKQLVTRVVELQRISVPEEGSQQDKIRYMKEQFAPMVEAVRPIIERVNGQILEQVWLNQTLLVSLPKGAIREVEAHQLVLKVDVPRVVTPD